MPVVPIWKIAPKLMMDIYETWKVDKEDSGSRILPSIVLTMFDKKIDGLHSMLAGPANKKSLEEECVFTCIFWLWIYFTSSSEGVQYSLEFSTVSAGFYQRFFISQNVSQSQIPVQFNCFQHEHWKIRSAAQLYFRCRCCIVSISYIYRIIFKIKTKTFFWA